MPEVRKALPVPGSLNEPGETEWAGGTFGLSDEVLNRIKDTVARHRPGLWAEEVDYGPGCLCGLSLEYIEGNAGYTRATPTGHCHRHGTDPERKRGKQSEGLQDPDVDWPPW